MVNKLLNARLDAVLTGDTNVSLHTWLSANWSTVTGYTVPASSAIKFDTKFGSGKGFFNFILVENMPVVIKPRTVGGARYHNIETKRIQIICIGTTAKTTMWNIQRHLDSLINGNPTGMWTTYGIDEIQISDFQEIQTSETSDTITNLQPNTGFQKTRSFATVTMKYDQYATTV